VSSYWCHHHTGGEKICHANEPHAMARKHGENPGDSAAMLKPVELLEA
jgi:hypothetical protein